MGADGREGDHGGRRVDERAARGQAVGRGAGGRGENQAVGSVFIDSRTVGQDRESPHAENVARLDDEVIQREGETAVSKTDFQEGAFFDAEISRENGLNRGADVFAGIGREKSKFAAIDAKERHAFEGGRFSHAEEGAVATDHATSIRTLEVFAADGPAVRDGEGHASFLGGFLHRVHDIIHPGLGAVDDEREAADGHE